MRSKKTINKFGKNILLILVAALFLPIQGAFAEMYFYTFDFDDDLYIWDLTGSYSEPLLGTGNLNFDLTQDDKGKLTGGGSADFDAEGYHFEMDFTITGTITEKYICHRGNIATLKMSLKFKGTADDGDDIYNFTGSETIKGDADVDSGTFVCTVKGRISIRGVGSERIGPTTTEVAIPSYMNGSSTLIIDAASDPKKSTKLLGDGSLILSNGKTITFSVKGKYDPKDIRDLCTFNLTSTNVKGSKLAITIWHNTGSVKSLNGKVLGQNFKLGVPRSACW